MTPHKVSFYLYADSEAQVQSLEAALYDFVSGLYKQGYLVTSQKLEWAIRNYGDSPLVKRFIDD